MQRLPQAVKERTINQHLKQFKYQGDRKKAAEDLYRKVLTLENKAVAGELETGIDLRVGDHLKIFIKSAIYLKVEALCEAQQLEHQQ